MATLMGYDPIAKEYAPLELKKGRLNMASQSVPKYSQIAEDTEEVYSWTTSCVLPGANQVALYIQNTDPDLKLRIQSLTLSATQNGVFCPQVVTSGTATGTAVTGLNWSAAKTALAMCKSTNVGGLTLGLAGSSLRVAANAASQKFDVDGAFILAENSAIAIPFSVAATVEVTIIGYYE